MENLRLLETIKQRLYSIVFPYFMNFYYSFLPIKNMTSQN